MHVAPYTVIRTDEGHLNPDRSHGVDGINLTDTGFERLSHSLRKCPWQRRAKKLAHAQAEPGKRMAGICFHGSRN